MKITQKRNRKNHVSNFGGIFYLFYVLISVTTVFEGSFTYGYSGQGRNAGEKVTVVKGG